MSRISVASRKCAVCDDRIRSIIVGGGDAISIIVMVTISMMRGTSVSGI